MLSHPRLSPIWLSHIFLLPIGYFHQQNKLKIRRSTCPQIKLFISKSFLNMFPSLTFHHFRKRRLHCYSCADQKIESSLILLFSHNDIFKFSMKSDASPHLSSCLRASVLSLGLYPQSFYSCISLYQNEPVKTVLWLCHLLLIPLQ